MVTQSGPPRVVMMNSENQGNASLEESLFISGAESLLEKAQAAVDTDKPTRAISLYRQVIDMVAPDGALPSEREKLIRLREKALLELTGYHMTRNEARELDELIRHSKPFLGQISKAKSAKIIRIMIDSLLDLDAKIGTEIPLCEDLIAWAQSENRVFLRHAVQTRLIALYHDAGQLQQGLALSGELLKEVKKLDDKRLVVETQLLESRLYASLHNLPKARAALTTARTAANSIYCPPKLQASLDMQSGILHAADERDFKTAYSYFYEAFEGLDAILTLAKPSGASARASTLATSKPSSVNMPPVASNSQDTIVAAAGGGPVGKALKYMLLCKIMLEQSADVFTIVAANRIGVKYASRDLEAIKAIAKASQNRSLAEFQASVESFRFELTDDKFVQSHLDALYDQMLSTNLCRLIEPFSRVQVSHIASLIDLPVADVERKLSQMILDKKFEGILSQGEGVLILYERPGADPCYQAGIATVDKLSSVVDQLYQKAKKLT